MISASQLHAPFLELSFYVGPGDHRHDVSMLLLQLRSQGAEASSEVWVKGRRGQVTTRHVEIEALPELSGVEEGFACRVKGLTGITSKDEVLEAEGSFVRLRTEAGSLSVPKPAKAAREAAGGRVYGAFKTIAASLDAAYGAICIEYSLETPAELREDSRSLAFRNFWLNRRRIDAEPLHRVEQAMSGAFVEEWATGVYFSSDPAYNPDRIGLKPEEALEYSVLVAEILAWALIA